MKRRASRWLLSGAAFALLSAGCGGDTGTASAPSGSASPAPTQGGATPSAPKETKPAETKEPAAAPTKEQAEFITLATTTSFDNTGLGQKLADQFRDETGISVKIIAQGTGQALRAGQDGNCDVLVVHAPASEKKLVDAGEAIERVTFMHNTFLIVGPEADPAKVGEATDEKDAFRRIAEAKAKFLSRGDDSGTHKKEQAIWEAAGIEPGDNYGETGQGMGPTLLAANEQEGYTLTDIGTYLKYKAEGNITLANLCDRGEMLYNAYSVMLVNPERFDPGHIKVEEARKFAEFLKRADVQKQIGEYMSEKFKQPLFVPDLLPKEDEK